MDSALVIYDECSGYRKFLGAGPDLAERLKGCCEHHMRLEAGAAEEEVPEGTDPDEQAKISGLGEQLSRALQPHSGNLGSPEEIRQLRTQIGVIHEETYPQMFEVVGRRVKSLIQSGTEPEDIVVLVPLPLRHASAGT